MITLTFTNRDLVEVLQQAVGQPGRPTFVPAVVNTLPQGVEILAGEPRRNRNSPASIEVTYAHQPPQVRDASPGRNLVKAGEKVCAQVIFWGEGESAGIYGLALLPGEAPVEIDFVKVAGPGMPLITTGQRRAVELKAIPARWSRSIGSLGLNAWERLGRTCAAIVGCGRSGSLVATGLARLGVQKVILIDPDQLETHNLDAMEGVFPGQEGQLKVAALKTGLLAINPDMKVEEVPYSVTALKTLPYLKESDLVICCTDDDGARWTASVIASLYLKPLLDIGTGVTGQGEGLDIGADVRLVLPGEGCLQCYGGFSNPEQVRSLRHSRSALEEERSRQQRDWRQERAGSLRSLNQIATGLGLRMLEDLYAARLEHSQWLRLQYAAGLPVLTTLEPADNRGCAVCQGRGRGDPGLNGIPYLPEPDPTTGLL